jgi:hypothetical protein
MQLEHTLWEEEVLGNSKHKIYYNLILHKPNQLIK